MNRDIYIKTVLVVPSHREKHFQQFLEAWRQQFAYSTIILVEDSPTKTFAYDYQGNLEHYAWDDIDRVLGEDAWIIGRHSAGIRCFGFLMAMRHQPWMIVTLDDDCFPEDANCLNSHWEALSRRVTLGWVPCTPMQPVTRGFPYEVRDCSEVVVNHGLWSGVPDLDAPTTLLNGNVRWPRCTVSLTVPKGSYFPMSGMNVSFKPQVTPLMYFPLQGLEEEHDGYEDVWCGVILKKICDSTGYAVMSGTPSVEHRRASNVYERLQRQAKSLGTNELFWRAVDSVQLTGKTVGDCYLEMADKLPLEGGYWDKLKNAMRTWHKLTAGGQ